MAETIPPRETSLAAKSEEKRMFSRANLHKNKKHFHINGFALSLALKQRLEATQKRLIARQVNYRRPAY